MHCLQLAICCANFLSLTAWAENMIQKDEYLGK